MGYKSNINYPRPTDVATENIPEDLHYYEKYSM